MKTRSFVTALQIALAVVVATPAVSLATSVLPSTLESMSDLADAVVIGRVGAMEGYWENRKIFTRVTVEVEEYLKHGPGARGKQVELRLRGGTVGDVTMEVDEAPRFESGERVLLFLKKVTGREAFQPFALYYGVYRVEFDATLGKDVVHGPYFEHDEHVDLKTKQKVKGPAFPVIGGKRGEGLDDFKQKVKGAVQR